VAVLATPRCLPPVISIAHFLKKADQAATEKMDDLMTRRKKKQEDTANSGK
jgi:hypothetical protein